MAYARNSEAPLSLEDEFYCQSRRRKVSLDRCLEGYVDANALEMRRRACYRCPQGRMNRKVFACGGRRNEPLYG